VATSGAAFVASVYAWANGLTAGALVLASLPVLGGLALRALRCGSLHRRALLVFGVIVALDLAWTASRAARASAEGPQVCVNARCDGRGALWQRVPDEREAARAGLYLSSLGGGLSGDEFRAFDALLDVEYARLASEWRGLPNALLMSSSLSRIESHRWLPRAVAPAPSRAPCLVFLHGFGGALTLYLRAIAESPIGQRFVVAAPVLDNEGAWNTPRGLAVLDRFVEQLPDVVDRSQIYLVGLSNGAVGATDVLRHPELRGRFRGIVLISGIAAVDPHGVVADGRVLVLAGARDPRFPPAWVGQQVRALRSVGAAVEVAELDADHYLILTHAPQWTERFLAWAAQ